MLFNITFSKEVNRKRKKVEGRKFLVEEGQAQRIDQNRKRGKRCGGGKRGKGNHH